MGRAAGTPVGFDAVSIDVTDLTFQAEVLEKSMSVAVVVDLWAPWCGPCKTLGPIIEKVVDETNGQVVLAKVNVDENPQISAAFQVQSIPAVYVIANGQVVDGFVGAQPEPMIREFVSRLLPSESSQAVRKLIEAGDEESIDRLHAEVQARQRGLFETVARALDDAPDAPRAAEAVRSLMFVARFLQDIERRRDALFPL